MIRLAISLFLLACLTAQAQGPLAAMLEKRRATVAAAGAWVPPQQSSLLIWFDTFTQAEIDAGKLNDSSGNNIHAYQTNATKRGTIVNGNAIKGNGTSSSWIFTNTVVTVSNHTVVAIAIPANEANKQFLSITDYDDANYDVSRLGLFRAGANTLGDGFLYHDGGTAFQDAGSPTVNDATATNKYWLAAMCYSLNNAYNVTIRSNDNAISIGTVDTACSFSISKLKQSGGYSSFLSYGATYYSDTTVLALMVYKTVLTTNELLQIKQHYIP